MPNFIEKLNFSADVDKMLLDLEHTLSQQSWPEKKLVDGDRTYHANQLGLTYRPEAKHPWFDASGSLVDKERRHFTGKESDFTEWNNVGDYTKSIIENLKKEYNINSGRIRYMRMMPKTGLSVHSDFERRYHFVLKTSPYAYFGLSEPDGDVFAKCFHIPSDGHFYKVDTTRPHFVYNGGWEPRIHLVICEST